MSTDAAQVIAPASRPDDRFNRVPMERHAMILVLPNPPGKTSRVTVMETATGGRLIVESGDSVFEREVSLNVRELRALATFANTIARRVANRPEWKP
jgi:hypothetical protein